MGDLSLGARLRLAREQTGMKLGAAAQAIGVSRDSLSDYENDITEPGAMKLKNAAEVYGTSADWLLWGRSRVKPHAKDARPSLVPGTGDKKSRKSYVDSPLVAAVR